MRTLDSLKIADNTIFVFYSDRSKASIVPITPSGETNVAKANPESIKALSSLLEEVKAAKSQKERKSYKLGIVREFCTNSYYLRTIN